MRNCILLLALLLSACAYNHPARVKTGAVLESHKSVAEPQPVAGQPPVSVETQPPVRNIHSDPAPKKNEHNIEED